MSGSLHSIPLVSAQDAINVFTRWAEDIQLEHRLVENGKPSDMIYFASAESGNLIKIGWSKDPAKRARELRSPQGELMHVRVALVGFGYDDERRLHKAANSFAVAAYMSNVNFEYYRVDTPIQRLMDRLVEGATASFVKRYNLPVLRGPRLTGKGQFVATQERAS